MEHNLAYDLINKKILINYAETPEYVYKKDITTSLLSDLNNLA